MNFNEYKCPVCDKQFVQSDDVVVCPECGTPHHRECFEKENHCYYQDKHGDGFSFEQLNKEQDGANDEYKKCSVCGAENPKEIFYCQQCGAPLTENKDKQSNQQTNSRQFNNEQTYSQNGPFSNGQSMNGMPPFGYGIPFDPMAGMNGDEPIANNVTAGEMSKFTGKNTPYFLRVFSRIKKLGSSRYNFCAFLFSGAYFLYRKMYALGVLFSFLTIGIYVATYYIYTMPLYLEAYNAVYANSSVSSLYSLFYTNSSVLTPEQMIIFNLPTILSAVLLAVRLICGGIANRAYYKHCTKAINQIKSENSTESINERLESKGGVNLAAAICIGVVYVVVMYLPIFIRI